MERVFEVAASITPLDMAAMEQARSRQLQLTKPPGSLGRLEEIAVQMAGITRQPLPEVKRKAVIVMAADHAGGDRGYGNWQYDCSERNYSESDRGTCIPGHGAGNRDRRNTTRA